MRAEPDKLEAGVVGLAIDQNEVGADVAVAVRLGKKYQKLLSFWSAGAARESGTHEHRTTSPLELQAFMGSGPAPAGRPGMTDFGNRRILAQSR